MPISMTDAFGPIIFNSIKELHKNLENASRKNARFIQTFWIKGLRSQSLKSNPVKKWDELSPSYANSSKKKKHSDLINILTGDFSNSIEIAKNNSGYYEVGTNANHKGFYYPAALETGTPKAKYPIPARPSLSPVLLLSKETVLENFKEAIRESFEK